MASYQGSSGTAYATTTPALGVGGEGEVFALQGNANLVVKIFKGHCRTEARRRKLEAMIASPLPPSAMQQVTWPTDILFESGAFVGYAMPRLNQTVVLSDIYDPSGNYKDMGMKNRITIAKNLCAAINSVHNAGQVCGDLNPKNIKVDPTNARVTLVDTDSYHITDLSGKVYRCEVGLPEYLPVEIQQKISNGGTLTTASLPTYSKESDCFALAVHIFALLMNGCHPFSTAVSAIAFQRTPSVTNPQPIDNIKNGFTPFFAAAPNLSIPTYAPSATTLPPAIRDLFQNAFVAGHQNANARPSTVEWFHELEHMEKQLSVCAKNKNHQYSSHLNTCPWCVIKQGAFSPGSVAPTPPKKNSPPANASKPKSKKWVAALAIVFAVLLGIIVPSAAVPAAKYGKAERLLAAGNYDAAKEMFLALGNYRDAMYMANEVERQRAEKFLESADFDDAIALYEDLGEYEKASETRYAKAKHLMDIGSFDEAIALFEELENFSDSRKMLVEANYQKALSMLQDGKYTAAIDLLSSLKGYGDSQEKVAEARYQLALQLIDADEYNAALDMIAVLKKSNNESDLLQRVYLGLADKFYEKGEVYQAILKLKDALALSPGSAEISQKIQTYKKQLTSCYIYDLTPFHENVDSRRDWRVGVDADNLGGSTYQRGWYYSAGLFSYNFESTFILDEYNFKQFKGTIAWTEDSKNETECRVFLVITGDGKQLYKSPNIGGGLKPVSFDIDVSQISELKIDFGIADWGAHYADFGLLDAQLYR
ncbi:MAG: NPCBM/NEW2 domain-containing protein [Oscillospiraceae bacterium]|nr:NPCBM/NEW2 domain-containing protein [Oscillospiraceae bacterium]